MAAGTTEERRARLVHLHESLKNAVAQAFDAAISIEEPAGSSPDWANLCRHYGVTMATPEERTQIIAAQKPLRGAPVMELSAMVKAIARWARLENKQIDTWDDPPDVKILGERMVRLVDRIDAELDVAYRGAVLPKRQGMFGNVKMHVDASAGPGKWDSVRAMTFKCKTCGGPRLKAGETICPFCDNPMA